MLKLFSYENWKKKKNLSNYFSSMHLRRIKASNFTSGWIQYHTRQGTGDSRDVMSIQEHLVLQFLYSSVVSFWVFNNPIHFWFAQFSSSVHKKTTEHTLVKLVLQIDQHLSCLPLGLFFLLYLKKAKLIICCFVCMHLAQENCDPSSNLQASPQTNANEFNSTKKEVPGLRKF